MATPHPENVKILNTRKMYGTLPEEKINGKFITEQLRGS